ncbi:MAG TPA: hypothetical protein V6C89_21360 [Drouetiella sp.]|jgi:hypothetical protein
MPTEQDYVNLIESAEKKGNYKEAFEDARTFIYGDPTLLQTNGAGWQDRASALFRDLSAATTADSTIIPPFSIVDGNGIEINTKIPDLTTPDGTRVSFGTGLSYTLSSDNMTLKVDDPNNIASGTWTWVQPDVSKAGFYTQNPPTPDLSSPRADVSYNANDPKHPDLIVTNPADQTITTFGADATTVSYVGTDGKTVMRSAILQANGLKINVEGQNDKPQRTVVQYPDGSTIEISPNLQRTASKVVVNMPNYHGQQQELFTVDSTFDAGKIPLQSSWSFTNRADGTTVSIDNQTLTLSVKTSKDGLKKYYMGGVDPEIDVAFSPQIQPTIAPTNFPINHPVSPFAPPATAVDGNQPVDPFAAPATPHVNG